MKKLLGFVLAIAMLLNIASSVTFAEEIILEEIFIEESFGWDFAANSLDSYTVELDLKNYYSFSSTYFCFYASDEAMYPTKYMLEPDYQLFVNGVRIDMFDLSFIRKYIEYNPVGRFELTDTYGSDIGYDVVNVEYYATTEVTSVTANRIYFDSVDNLSYLVIDQQTLEAEGIELNVYMNGEKIDASEIRKGDILSIKYDPTDARNSMFYDIYVSRESREGVFRSIDTDNKTVTIGAEDYVFVNWANAYNDGRGDFAKDKLSNEYKIYLDTFGRIYTWEKSTASVKYAIVDKYQQATASSTYDNDRVRLWFTDGTYSYVEFAPGARITLPDKGYATSNDVGDYIYENSDSFDVMNRVVSYKISSSTGKITSLEFIAGTKIENEYDEINEKIGSTIVSDATTFINVEEYISTWRIDDIETSSKENLVDGVSYTIYRYGTPSITDNAYPLIMILKGEADYTEKTAFAVVTKPIGSDTTEDGTFLDTLTVLYEGEEQTLFIDEEARYHYDLIAGDVVVFKKNASGKIKEVVRIFEAKYAGFDNYHYLKSNGLIAANFNAYTVNPVGGNPFTMVWNPTDPELVKLIYAPIVSFKGRKYFAQVDSSGNSYIGKEATMDATYSEGATLDIMTTDDTRVYVYDYSLRAGKRFYVGSTDDIIGTAVDHLTTLNGDYYTIDWSWIETDEQINFAYAKIVDDIVTDIFVIKKGEQIFNTDDGIIGSITNVISVSSNKIVVNVVESLAKVYAVDYDGDALARVQSFDAIKGKQTFTAEFLPDAVYIWDDNMEALSLPWRSERDAGSDIRVELDLAQLDDDEYAAATIEAKLLDGTNPYVYFYASDAAAKSTKYKLEKGYKLFVNGVQLSNVDSAAVMKYIINNPVGKFELTDTFGSAEGYDVIDVEYYTTVKVTSVSSNKIYFNKVADLNVSSLPIDIQTLEAEGIELNVYMNGEIIDPSEIKMNDILSIKFNPILRENSNFFDIYVSREVREGMFMALGTEEKTVTIGSENYIFINWTNATYEFKKENLANEYKIYLDSFGRIYTWEVAPSSIKYAIVDKYQIATASSTYDNDRVRLWFTDGTYEYVEFATTAKITTPESYDNSFTGVQNYINDNATKDKVMNRVVTYKISSSTGKITSLEFLAGAMVENKYDERNEKIGSTIISDDTKLVNVEEFISTGKIDDIEISSKDALADGVQYTTYRYGTPSMIDNSYPLVIIVKGEADYTEETTFAVVTKAIGSGVAEDGTVLDTLTVLYEGEEQVLFIDEEAWYDYDLVAGDVVVLKKNNAGRVKEIIKIFNAKDAGFYNYSELVANSLIADFDKYITNPVAGNPFTTVWNPTDPDLVKLIYAPIVSFKGRKYFAQVDSSYKTYIDKETSNRDENNGGTLEILTTDYTNVYVYDYNAAKNEKFYIGSVYDIIGTDGDYATLEGYYYTIDWYSREAETTTVNFAFAKIVDDIVTDIFVIIGEDE